MTTRERKWGYPAGDGPNPAGGGNGELRARADDLLRAGDDAIDRALSENPEEFLTGNRQTVGQ